jgi:hypothetical protein
MRRNPRYQNGVEPLRAARGIGGIGASYTGQLLGEGLGKVGSGMARGRRSFDNLKTILFFAILFIEDL